MVVVPKSAQNRALAFDTHSQSSWSVFIPHAMALKTFSVGEIF